MFDPNTTAPPLFYTVEFMRSDGSGSVFNTTNVTANQREIRFQNLDKGVNYQANITAYNVRGPGATTPLAMVQTLVDRKFVMWQFLFALEPH